MTDYRRRTGSLVLVWTLLSLTACTGMRSGDPMDEFEQANRYYSKGLYSDAERILLRLAKNTPDNYEVYFKLGNIYVRTGQFEAAERVYRRCIEIDPRQPRAWYNLSLLRVKQALYLAEEGARRSDEESPQFAPAFTQLSDGLISVLGDKH